jgi:acetolactate synthase-1/3 small subunit
MALSVGETENPAVSRITALTEDNEKMLSQICSQVCKLEDVRTASVLSANTLMERELALIKIRPDTREAGRLMQLVSDFSAKSMAAGECVVIEVSGEPEKINRLIELLRQFHIVELSRTGPTALELNGKPLAEYKNNDLEEQENETGLFGQGLRQDASARQNGGCDRLWQPGPRPRAQYEGKRCEGGRGAALFVKKLPESPRRGAFCDGGRRSGEGG